MTLMPVSQEYEYDPVPSPPWIPYRVTSIWSFKDPGYFRLGMSVKTKLKRLLRVERLQSVEYQRIQTRYHKDRGFIEITYKGRGNDRVFKYFEKLFRDSSGTLLDLEGEIEGDGINYKFRIAWLHSTSCSLIDYRSWGKRYWYTIRFYICEELKLK